MKVRLKKGIAVFLTAMMVLAMAFQSIAAPLSYAGPTAASEPAKITGTWSTDASGSWRFNAPDGAAKDGWYYLNTTNNATDYNWFCFDANGVMRTGWVQDKNDPSVWYYTGESKGSSEGGLVKGWITDPQDGKKYYLDPSTGIMCHGWKQISGVWYYFGESRYADRRWAPDTTGYWKAGASGKHSYGSLYMNEWTPDGYYVGANGAWVQNHSEDDNSDKPDPVPEYSITVENDGNGTASASAQKSAAGKEITLTAAPNEGYRFKEWNVVSGGVTVTENKFTMPANNVTVKAVFENKEVPVTSVSLDKTEVTIEVGEEVKLIATVAPDNATDKSVTWSSSDTDVATVDNKGKVHAVALGDATITVTTVDGNKTASCAVKVTAKTWGVIGDFSDWADVPMTEKESNVFVSPAIELTTNNQFKVRYGASWDINYGAPTGTEPYVITSGTPVEAMEGGSNLAVPMDGEYTVTLNLNNSTITVTKVVVPVASVSLDKTEVTITVGDPDEKLTATVAPDNATNKAVTWSSSDESVATVDDEGNVHAVAAGKATITVTTVDGNKTATCTVTVVGACLAAGTMISMPEGKQKAVEELEIGDVVCTFDHETGEMSSAPVCFIWESKNVGNAFTLTFEGDIEVTVIEEHGFYDQEKQKYVFINLQNAQECIGDHFYHADTNSWLALKSCEALNDSVDAYAIITSGDLNHMSNGMLSMCDGSVKVLANIFEYDDQMKFDADKKKADIEKYGLTPKEKILELKGFTEAGYDIYNLQYVDVMIGKGLITWEWMEALSDYCVANGLVCIEQNNDVPMLGTEEKEPIIKALAPRSKPESCEPEKLEEAKPEELIEPAEAVAEEAAP
ncbi:MAG: Ig-like domain-containing protein [Eubacteriales bacterium]|nr:Ig-like domain-containing protein [Eubacteriales bacterium]